MSETASAVLTWIVLTSSAMAALIYLGKKTVQAFKTILALNALVQYELNPNGGGSIKDSAKRAAESSAAAAKAVEEMRAVLNAHLLASAEERVEMWRAIGKVAEADPPPPSH